MKAKFNIIMYYIFALIISYISYKIFLSQLNLLIATLLVDIICTIIIFFFSKYKNNSSVYDSYWSLIPPFIVLFWIFNLKAFSIYSYIILAVYLIWGIRLTLNWFINWKGFHHEDWRYVNFRQSFRKFYWLISFMGIHLFPTIMVFLGLLPIYFGLEKGNIANIILFTMGIIISLIGIFISFLADIQLTKHRKSVSKDFALDKGIWKYSRHPNYLGELSFWLGSFVIGISYSINNYFTIIGFIGMLLLFNFYSIPAMEKRLLQSKRNYKDIMKKTKRLLPLNIFKIN